MINLAKIGLVVLSVVITSTVYASSLTEQSVSGLISNLNSAIAAQSAQGISNSFSESADISMHITSQGQAQILRPSKSEYISMIQQGWSQYTDYTYTMLDISTSLQADKAIVTAHIKETMIIQGQPLTINTTETFTVEMVAGQPVITQLTGQIQQ